MPAKAHIWMSAILSLNVLAESGNEDLPDLELLEFIVEWRSDGEPVDPRVFTEESRMAGQPREGVDDEAR